MLAQPGLTLAGLTAEIAVDACTLPADFRSDPADHLIIATARSLGAAVVTHDQRIIDYARLGHVAVVSA